LINSRDKLQSEIDRKRVLVIGGAGTIGAEFIKSILGFRPQALTVVDIDENGLTELVRDVRSSHEMYIPNYFKTYPLNFGSRIFEKIYLEKGPFDIVANFAAHKHVRSEKDVFSVKAMIENNILFNFNLLSLIESAPPAHFFCVSTDKASNPVNLMGATKKYMEQMLVAYGNTISLSSARFANVAFSQGSLLAGFLERIVKKQPISAPTDVKRFFISPEESGQLCLIACLLGKSKDIFFPKLEPDSMKGFAEISDLLLQELGLESNYCSSEQEAKEMAGKRNALSKNYPVFYFESDTTGEKLFEEFYSDSETVDLHSFQSLGIIKDTHSDPISIINQQMEELKYLSDYEKTSKSDLIDFFQRYLPDFHHLETGRYLDDKM